MTPEEQVDRNLASAFRFIQAVLADPAILDDMPDEAVLVPAPPDDPALEEANLTTDRHERQAQRQKQRNAGQPTVRDALSTPRIFIAT